MFGEGMAMTKSQANKERAVDDKLLALTEGVRNRGGTCFARRPTAPSGPASPPTPAWVCVDPEPR